MARNVLYPLYQLGNPQLRVFRTNFFVRLVRPGTAQPEDTVQFRIPMEMTRVDLRNYLERIYDVPVAAVRTRVQHGSHRKRDHRNSRVKRPDYKVAYVQLLVSPAGARPDLRLPGPVPRPGGRRGGRGRAGRAAGGAAAARGPRPPAGRGPLLVRPVTRVQ
ncbi:39S ribosomal protein L23, mitochondrial isoform X1 [Talpa occidentalis]|uniref:39S ribosomal protein L23, mitochondrial isoform X1 n=1 Tax=Talpa occidentalis TaxID=50954 RepID=UPI0023FA40BD|nr:39S ribosomal protein L23, mitochondrial isoform X1 [Talpa occidentalis]